MARILSQEHFLTIPSTGTVKDPGVERALADLRQKFPLGQETLADNSVGSDQIAADAVGSSEIAADAVGSSEIAADAVGSSEIAAGAVGTSEAPTFVNSTVENLKVIRGIVDTSGSGTILEGSGFTIARNGAGDVTVTFSAAFSDVPAVNLTAVAVSSGLAVANLSNATPVSTTQFRAILFVSSSGASSDEYFHFQAIGPR